MRTEQNIKDRYEITAGKLDYDANFPLYVDTDVAVYLSHDDGVTETLLTNGTHYTVAIAQDKQSGTVTLKPAAGAVAGDILFLMSNLPYKQELDLNNVTTIDTNATEMQLDRDCQQRQQLAYLVNRAALAPVTSGKTGAEYFADLKGELENIRDDAISQTEAIKDDAVAAKADAEDARDDAWAYRTSAQNAAVNAQNSATAAQATLDQVRQETIGKIDNVMANGGFFVWDAIAEGESATIVLPDNYKVGAYSLMLFDKDGNYLVPKSVDPDHGVYDEDGTVGEVSNFITLYGPVSEYTRYYYQIIGLNAASLVDDNTIKWDEETGISVDAEAVLGDVEDVIREDVEDILNHEYQKVDTKTWSATQNYAAGAFVTNADGNLYLALQASGPSTTVVNPVGDTTYTWKNISLDVVINVKDFGALGDRDAEYVLDDDPDNPYLYKLVGTVHDDTQKINAALAYVAEKGGGIVYIPDGKYSIQNYIVIGSNTTILCSDGAQLYADWGGGFIRNVYGVDTSSLISPAAYEGPGNIKVIGGTWDICGYAYANRDGTTHTTNGFTIVAADGFSMRDMIVKNGIGVHALDMAASRHVLIENCRFLGCATPYDDSKECLQLDGNDSDSTFWGTRDGSPNYDVIVRNCFCGLNPDRETDGTWPVFVGSHNAWGGKPQHHVVIENCHAEYVPRMIHPYGWEYVVVKNNVCENGNLLQCGTPGPEQANMTQGGVGYYGLNKHYLVSGNKNTGTVNGSLQNYAVYINGPTSGTSHKCNTDIVIENNIFDGCIYGSSCDNIRAIGNTVSSAVQGIMFYSSRNTETRGNTLDGAVITSYAIQITSASSTSFPDYDCANHRIIGNLIKNKTSLINYHCKNVIIYGNQMISDDNSSLNFFQINSVAGQVSIVGNSVYASGGTLSTPKTVGIVNASKYTTDGFVYSQNVLNPADSYTTITLHGATDGKLNPSFSGPVAFKKEGTNSTHPAALEFQGFSASIPNVAFKSDEELFFGTYPNSSDIATRYKTYTALMSMTASLFGPVAAKDNAFDLGSATRRYGKVYAGTGSIQTSDARLKDNIEDIDEAVFRAWGKVNYKVFQFRDSIAEKGSTNARLHTGIIAQEIAEAFASEGLDATRYGLFCYDVWDDQYETRIVEDVPAVLDEDGNETTPAVTHEEQILVLPAGDRYSLRYDECLALEAAYQRWRANNLRDRVAVLERKMEEMEQVIAVLGGGGGDD